MAVRSRFSCVWKGVRFVVSMESAGPMPFPTRLMLIRWSSGRWLIRRVWDLRVVKSDTKDLSAVRGIRSIMMQAFCASSCMESSDMVVHSAAFMVWTASTSQPRRGTPSIWRSRRRVSNKAVRLSSDSSSIGDDKDDKDDDDDDDDETWCWIFRGNCRRLVGELWDDNDNAVVVVGQ